MSSFKLSSTQKITKLWNQKPLFLQAKTALLTEWDTTLSNTYLLRCKCELDNIIEFLDKHNILIMVEIASYEMFGAQLISGLVGFRSLQGCQTKVETW